MFLPPSLCIGRGEIQIRQCFLLPLLASRHLLIERSLLIRFANAPTCYRAPEPETPKLHFKVPKMPFWTPPPKDGPQKSIIKRDKIPLLHILIPQKWTVGTFYLTFGAVFPGGPKWHFFGLSTALLGGVSGFRGSVAGRGGCNIR